MEEGVNLDKFDFLTSYDLYFFWQQYITNKMIPANFFLSNFF